MTTIMKNAGHAHMGVGRKRQEQGGRSRAYGDSQPLMETSIDGAKGVLINITGSMDMGLEECIPLRASLRKPPIRCGIIFGAAFDDTMDDEPASQ